MSFKVKGISRFDLHVYLTLKSHLLRNIFQISNFRFSLEYVARGDYFLIPTSNENNLIYLFIPQTPAGGGGEIKTQFL